MTNQQVTPQSVYDTLKWERIALSDKYRSMDNFTQSKVKRLWLQGIAPIIYGPQVAQDPKQFSEVASYVHNFQVPVKKPDEDVILTPDTFSLEGIAKVESNPEFARKPYKEQQDLRRLWYMKSVLNDPNLGNLDRESQAALYERVMKRPPAYASKAYNEVWDKQGWKGLVNPIPLDEIEDGSWEKTNRTLGTIMSNFFGSFVSTGAGLLLGPVNAMFKDSQLAYTLHDVYKEREWLNSSNDDLEFFLETIPSFAGSLTGIMSGPYMHLDKGLAGTVGLTKATEGGARKIVTSPGIFQKVGEKLTTKIPTLGYRIAGGATAGAMLGVGQALTEGQKWNAYLATDATLGVGIEILTQYFGALRAVKRAAKDAGVSVDNILRTTIDLGSAHSANPELEKILSTNTDLRKALNTQELLDKDGLLFQWSKSPEGVKAKAEMVGLRITEQGEKSIVTTKTGKKPLFESAGSIDKRVSELSDYLDTRDDLWKKSLKGKNIYDILFTSPTIEVRRTSIVPTKQRELTVAQLQKFGINNGVDYRIDPRGDTTQIDNLIGIVRNNSPKKAMRSLQARGIQFLPDEAENLAEIKQFKADLEKIQPKTPTLFVNQKTGDLIDSSKLPVVVMEGPDVAEPFYNGQVYTGNFKSITELFSTIKRYTTTAKTQTTKKAKGLGVMIQQLADNEPVEMVVRVPTGKKTAEVILHFPTFKVAQEYLTKGRNKGLKGIADIFTEEDKEIAKAYEKFRKDLWKNDRARAQKESIPFLFTSKKAKQQGYQLGTFKGNYILHSGTDPANTRYLTFNSLNDVINVLNANDRVSILPNMLGNLSEEALEEVGTSSRIADLPKIEELQISSKRRYGILTDLATKFQPTQWAVETLDRLGVMSKLKDEYGLSTVRLYNNLQDANRLRISFESGRRKFLQNLRKGVDAKGAKVISDYMEALAEGEVPLRKSSKVVEQPTKAVVYQNMVDEFGKEQADTLVEKAVQLEKFYQDLFARSGMSYSMFLRHYVPHHREVVQQGINANQVEMKRMTDIPDSSHKFFFEMLREVDEVDSALERDAFKLAETYTHLMGRKLFMRPTLEGAKKELGTVLKALKESKKEAQYSDYAYVVNYFTKMFESLDGITQPGEKRFRMAVQNTFETLEAKLKEHGIPFDSKAKRDPIAKLVTLTTGAHLAARPYPIARNLTQSLITGSIIGPNWWLHGVDNALTPQSIKEMMDKGIVETIAIPSGSGFAISPDEWLGKIVSKAMEGYKWSDWMNRTIIYKGMEARVQHAFDLFKANKITQEKFLRMSGAKLFGKAQFNDIARLWNTAKSEGGTIDAVKDRIARLAVERTQYLYDKFNSPEMFRSGIGRLAGQYTTWPLGYFNLVKGMLSSDTLGVADKAQILTGLGISAGAIATGAHSAGLSQRTYLPWNMGMMDTGPYFNLLLNTLKSANGDEMAYRDVVDTVSTLVPFVYAGSGLEKGIQALQSGDLYEAFLLFASAPINYELYPRRDSSIDKVRDALVKGGKAYFEAKNSQPFGVQ